MSQYPPQPPNQPPPTWQGYPPQQPSQYPPQNNTGWQQQPSGPLWPPQSSPPPNYIPYPQQSSQQVPFYTYPENYQHPTPGVIPPPSGPPQPPRKKLSRRAWIIIGVVVLILVIASAANANKSSDTPTAAAPTATPTTIIVNSQATDTPIPTPTPQSIHYPPTTGADLRGLAAKGDASAIHEFHSESVGLTGVCPQPKREITVDPRVTGQKFAEDLLAYFYAQQLDSPCGSIVFAYHTQAEANDLYTAGRISFTVTDSSGAMNSDPNASNLKYTLTLDIGGALTGQEYVISY